MSDIDTDTLLRTIARRYPPQLVEHELRDLSRTRFLLDLTVGRFAGESLKRASVCDLGGGSTPFIVACAAMGVERAVLVDDFRDPDNAWVTLAHDSPQSFYGVEIHSRDLIAQRMTEIAGPFDVITCFNSMEHFHNSPKTLFAEAVSKLRPGGMFVLSAPNCVNLRKRMTIPFGVGRWSHLSDWYDTEVFRGHVREPDIGDLAHIASSLGLVDVRTFGRNWTGYYSPKKLTRVLTHVVDRPLRFFPSMCADIYVVGYKRT